MVSFFDAKLNQNKTDYTDVIDTINDGDYNVLHLKQKDKLKILVGNIVMNDDLINTPFDDIEVSKNYPNNIFFSNDMIEHSKKEFYINKKKQIEQYINSDDNIKPEFFPSSIVEQDKHIPELFLNNSHSSIILEEDKHIPELVLNNSPSSIILKEDKHIPELVLNSKKKNKKKKKKN